jgi:hypothetical protein
MKNLPWLPALRRAREGVLYGDDLVARTQTPGAALSLTERMSFRLAIPW